MKFCALAYGTIAALALLSMNLARAASPGSVTPAFSEPIPEANNDTPEIICTRGLEAQKIKEKAPAYITKLRQEMGVEILDPTLKAATDAIMSATNAPVDANN